MRRGAVGRVRGRDDIRLLSDDAMALGQFHRRGDRAGAHEGQRGRRGLHCVVAAMFRSLVRSLIDDTGDGLCGLRYTDDRQSVAICRHAFDDLYGLRVDT